jgi:hypothetical protein
VKTIKTRKTIPPVPHHKESNAIIMASSILDEAKCDT